MAYRMLTEGDRDVVLGFLNEDKLANVMLIGEIQIFGFEDKSLTFYGEFVDGELVSVVDDFNSVMSNYYTNGNGNVADTAELLNRIGWKQLTGQKEAMEKIKPLITYKEAEDSHWAVTEDYDFFDVDGSFVKTMTTEAEMEKLLDLYLEIDEFGIFKSASREFFNEFHRKVFLNSEHGMKTIVKVGDGLVAAAGATCENDEFALLEGVATLPGNRKKGYASMAVMQLMNEYKRKNKRLCLTYTNPAAWSIYHRLGFENARDLMIFTR